MNPNIVIRIDVRETELIAKCQSLATQFPNVNFLNEQLPLGDIIINDGQEELIIIERKSLADLAASIKDGRYTEQSYRLNGIQHHNHNIVYLIEGDFSKFNAFKYNAFKGDKLDKQALYSAMFSINYYKGFSLMRSQSVDETATIIFNMAHKLAKDKTKKSFYSNSLPHSLPHSLPQLENLEASALPNLEEDVNVNANATAITDKEYCAVIKKVKKDNVTAENIGEIMLCQIPGVSSASALAIFEQFKTLPNLIKCIDADNKCLDKICTKDANGKARKISKTTIATIVLLLSTFEKLEGNNLV
jgi:ERCC4-type nuclease